MKKVLALVLAGIMLIACCACGQTNSNNTSNGNKGNEAPAVTPVVFKVGHTANDGQPLDNGLDLLAQEVEKRTEGRVKIEVFPGSTLGSDTEMRDMVEKGTIDMCSFGYTTVGNWYKALGLPQMLFNLKNEKELLGIIKGAWGEKYYNEPLLKEHGIRVLDQWPQGPRLLMSKRPVRTLEDLNGLKLRTPAGIPVREESWSKLGAMTLSLALSDAFTSISTGVCDAVELPIDYLASYHFEEQLKYLTMTRHIIISNALLINEDSWKKVSEADQKIFMECVEEAGAAVANELASLSTSIQDDFKKAGVEIIELTDEELAKFRATIDPLYEKYMDDWGKEAYDDYVKAMDAIRK